MREETKTQNFESIKIKEVRIVHGLRGFPIRNNATLGHTKPTGMFMSRKCGRAMPWESFHELHLMWISECDTSVWRYLAQPLRLELYVPHQTNPIIYFPDIERHLEGGVIEVIEVKKTEEEVDRDPFYAFKIGMAKKVFRAAEIRFRTITADKYIDIEPRLGNARMISLDRFTKLESIDAIRLGDAFEKAGGTIAYGKAIETLSERGNPRDPGARAKLHASVVDRTASIDLKRRITLDSPVTEANR